MALEGAARTARLDQDKACLDEVITGLVGDTRLLLTEMDDVDGGEFLVALTEVLFEDLNSERLALVAAGCLLRLAQEKP